MDGKIRTNDRFQLDPSGPSALLMGTGAILLSLGWSIYRSRPSRREVVVVIALLCVAVLLACPVRWPPAQAIASALQHYRPEQIATFVCAMVWLWCAWAAVRLGWRRLRMRQHARLAPRCFLRTPAPRGERVCAVAVLNCLPQKARTGKGRKVATWRAGRRIPKMTPIYSSQLWCAKALGSCIQVN